MRGAPRVLTHRSEQRGLEGDQSIRPNKWRLPWAIQRCIKEGAALYQRVRAAWSHLFHFRLHVSPPGVSWPSSFPLPLWIPCHGLSGDTILRFSRVYWSKVLLFTLSDHFTFIILRRYLFTKVLSYSLFV